MCLVNVRVMHAMCASQCLMLKLKHILCVPLSADVKVDNTCCVYTSLSVDVKADNTCCVRLSVLMLKTTTYAVCVSVLM